MSTAARLSTWQALDREQFDLSHRRRHQRWIVRRCRPARTSSVAPFVTRRTSARRHEQQVVQAHPRRPAATCSTASWSGLSKR